MLNGRARRAGTVSLLTMTLMIPLAAAGASATESQTAELSTLKVQYAIANGIILQDFWCWTGEIGKGFSKGAVIGFFATIEAGGAPGAVLGGAGGIVSGVSDAKDKC